VGREKKNAIPVPEVRAPGEVCESEGLLPRGTLSGIVPPSIAKSTIKHRLLKGGVLPHVSDHRGGKRGESEGDTMERSLCGESAGSNGEKKGTGTKTVFGGRRKKKN